jgi:2-methylaconitate cis-trans-isomerase PrpF
VPTVAGRAATTGDWSIPGVPGTGARIDLDFQDPCGSVTGQLLPTSRPRDLITVADGRTFQVSVVDAANPMAFLLASELGLTGVESPQQIEANTKVTAVLEEVRGIVAERIGVVSTAAEATAVSPGLPKVGFVSTPVDHHTSGGELVLAAHADVVGRLMSMQTAHRSYMLTGAVCTAAAAVVAGSVVHEVARQTTMTEEWGGGRAEGTRRAVRIAHPFGVMTATVTAGAGGSLVSSVAVERTARAIMDGRVHVPAALLA